MDDPPATFEEQPEWVTSWLARRAETERAEQVAAVPLAERIQAAIDRIEAHRAAKRSKA
jgi:hypothetical protein